MKIAVIGCGALGSFYGAKLCRAGHEVHFLLRSDYDVVRREGVQILSPQGDFRVHPKVAHVPEEIGICDLVLIGLKTTANSQFPKLIPPLVGKSTAILTLQNGLGNEEQLAALSGEEKVLGGLCFVCLNRIEPGKILHVAQGAIVMGEFQRPPRARTHEIASAIRDSGVPCDVTSNIAQAHWEKLVWNIPFNGLGVAGTAGCEAVIAGELESGKKLQSCLTTDILLREPHWNKLVRELMVETISAAQALGLDVRDSEVERQIGRTYEMGAYKASTLIDFERGQPLELDSLFMEPLRQAQNAGVRAPRLAALGRVLKELNERQRK